MTVGAVLPSSCKDVMQAHSQKPTPASPGLALTDEEVVARILGGHAALFEVLMRRYNQRLYRVARAIVGEAEAEDVVQDAYVRAFRALRQFAGRAKLSTWLTRIVINEALRRKRKRRRETPARAVDAVTHAEPAERGATSREDGVATVVSLDPELATRTPEGAYAARELAAIVEEALSALSAPYRVVFVLREVEGVSTAGAAELLGTSEEVVKVRLHRARQALRLQIEARLGAAVKSLYGFAGWRCDRIVARVFQRLGVAASTN